ncbi:dual specificity protein phosphatase family protein [Candidatus Woesearchaeota archaeon]|nr:dual specificity protein phosphatase family protein [Candidatus Woesearchaeota archaeon]
MNIHPTKIPFEYHQITKYIYIGSNACCRTHFSDQLLKKGIKADISLEENRIEQPWGVSFFLWLPTKNHAPPTVQQFNIGIAMLRELIRNKIKVYVHCQRGHGRAPTLVAAYLISQGMTTKETIDYITKKRPVIHLDSKQVAALKKFEKMRKH